jgi:hypothetical protein
MPIEVISAPTPLAAVRRAAEEQFGDFVKAVVDVRQELMAIGGAPCARGSRRSRPG